MASATDYSADEKFALDLQMKEIENEKQSRKKSDLTSNRRRVFRTDTLATGTTEQRPSTSRESAPVERMLVDDDIIVIDDDVPDELTRPNRIKNKKKNDEETLKNDEILARQLQEQLDKEVAAEIASRDRHRRPHSTIIDRPSHLFGVPSSSSSSSFQRDSALPRHRSFRINSSSSSTNQPDLHGYFTSTRSSDDSMIDPIRSLAEGLNQSDNFRRLLENRRQTGMEQLNLHRANNNFMSQLANIGARGGFSRRNNLFASVFNDRDFSSDDYETLLQLDELNKVKKGLSKQELESLPEINFKKQTSPDTDNDDNSNTCSICYDDFENRQKLTMLFCTHKFHKKCIKSWLQDNRTCPLCKKDAVNGA